jgi:predicted Co/Zn/Cd cation transporter (cation efflux family)
VSGLIVQASVSMIVPAMKDLMDSAPLGLVERVENVVTKQQVIYYVVYAERVGSSFS